MLGVAPNDSWLDEPVAELAPDFVERLRAALHEAGVDAAVDGAAPSEAIARVVELRDDARRAKDWAASDRLRDALQHCGIEIKDSKEGTTWSVASAG